jgi:hypothetical protein
MKALSFKPPWGYLCATVKDIENRSWPLPRNFELPQRIYIHQGKIWNWMYGDVFIRVRIPLHRLREIMTRVAMMHSSYQANHILHPNILAEVWGIGAIIGEVDITGCIHTTDIGHPDIDSPWFVGPYGFILRNAVLYKHPIPCKGRLGFFIPELPKRLE